MSFPDTMERPQLEEKAQAAAKAMLELPQVSRVFWLVQPDDGKAILWVVPEESKKADLHEALRAKLAPIKECSSRVGGLYSPLFPWPSDGAQIAVRLSGKDFETLHKTAEKLRQRLVKSSGLIDVEVLPRLGEVASIEINREKAELAGMTVREVSRAITAHAVTLNLSLFDDTLRIKMEAPRRGVQKATLPQLEQLELFKGSAETSIVLGDVAKVRLINAPIGAITHEAGELCVLVFANLEGRTLEEGRAEVKRLIKELAGDEVRFEVE
jgi:Cu/Ag efflux pump CusA